MRVHPTAYSESCKRTVRTETIGELVVVPNFPDQEFAVHANPYATERNREPLFCVTHVGTGFRLAGGDSPDFAIRMAVQYAEKKTPEEFAKALRRAHQLMRSQVTQLSIDGDQ